MPSQKAFGIRLDKPPTQTGSPLYQKRVREATIKIRGIDYRPEAIA